MPSSGSAAFSSSPVPAEHSSVKWRPNTHSYLRAIAGIEEKVLKECRAQCQDPGRAKRTTNTTNITEPIMCVRGQAVPGDSDTGVTAPRTPECDCTWRQGLSKSGGHGNGPNPA